MTVMRRSSLSESRARSPLLARLLITALAAVLLVGVVDLHTVLHQRERALDAAAHGEHHPEPAHLDSDSVDVQCLACLFGLKSQNRPAEAPGAIARPQTRGRRVAADDVGGAAGLPYRLPLTRAPPLS